jgi:ferredoxin-thioredoxin reductase catalytic subunit
MKIIINPDVALVKEVREGLKRTGGYCPCRVVRNDDTKCLCKEFRDQTSTGECYCGLYIKVEETGNV